MRFDISLSNIVGDLNVLLFQDLYFIFYILVFCLNLFDIFFCLLPNIIQVHCQAIILAQIPVRKLISHVIGMVCLIVHLQMLMFHSQVVIAYAEQGKSVFERLLQRVVLVYVKNFDAGRDDVLAFFVLERLFSIYRQGLCRQEIEQKSSLDDDNRLVGMLQGDVMPFQLTQDCTSIKMGFGLMARTDSLARFFLHRSFVFFHSLYNSKSAQSFERLFELLFVCV